MVSAEPLLFEWPPGLQSLRDLQPWRHTLALSSARLRVNAFGNASVCRRVEGVGAQRRRPEPGGPLNTTVRQSNRHTAEDPKANSGSEVRTESGPKLIVNRRVRDGRSKELGRERLRRAGTGAATGTAGVCEVREGC